jgi:hypothetical protein
MEAWEGLLLSTPGSPNFSIIADETSITFDYRSDAGGAGWAASDLSLAPSIHNGIAINFVSGGHFSGVSINPLTNMVGFDLSRISIAG